MDFVKIPGLNIEMATTSVTQQEWIELMEVNPSVFIGATRPVDCVHIREALKFCQRLTAKTGVVHRLPTDAEWIHALRAGGETIYGPMDDIAWYRKNSDGQTHTVKQKKPNAWGLYDMIGNVSEWTFQEYTFGSVMTTRGGHMNKLESDIRSQDALGRVSIARNPVIVADWDVYNYRDCGFRVVRELP